MRVYELIEAAKTESVDWPQVILNSKIFYTYSGPLSNTALPAKEAVIQQDIGYELQISKTIC